jgi:hypothetical protein
MDCWFPVLIQAHTHRAYTYIKNGNGALILAKVVLGNIKLVSDWEEVKFCPPGYNSVRIFTPLFIVPFLRQMIGRLRPYERETQ